jgi:hypothetical protein
MGVSNDPKEEFEKQIFWVGRKKDGNYLSNWYSFVCRAPQLRGHIILSSIKNSDINKAPKGFEKALNLNIDFLLEWANKHKSKDCYPVFLRMNIRKEQFRIHIHPVSNQEINQSTRCLKERIPKSKDKGGFIYYLGQHEHDADKSEAEEYGKAKSSEDHEKLLRRKGIIKIRNQLRKIVSAKGYKAFL